ncbi:MAG: acyl-CoA dehydrogenase family protein [Myxococcota bacterium]
MDLDFSEEQEILRGTVRALCDEYAPLDVVRSLEDDPVGYPSALWKQMAELGLLGIQIPEVYGGAAQTALESLVVYEELGRALPPSPHFASAVMSAGLLLAAGSEEQRQSWLPKIVSGEAIITPAWLEPQGGFGPAGVQLAGAARKGEYRLSGTKRHVLFASSAKRLLVLVRSGEAPDAIDLVLVDPGAPGVRLKQQLSLASDCQYEVTFDDVRVPVSERLGAAGSGWRFWEEVMHDGMILYAAQAMGGAARALEMTVAYAKERHQFGKPLAAFQAISHYLADAVTSIDGGTTLAREAAWARATGRPVDQLAPMAKLFACQTFRDVTAMAQQVFGGVGFTVEFDIQLYFRRAKQLQVSWWDSRYLEERVAAAVLDRRGTA